MWCIGISLDNSPPTHTHVHLTVYSMFCLLQMSQPMLSRYEPATAFACTLVMWHTTNRWTCNDRWVHSMWQPLESKATAFGVSVSKPVSCTTSELFLIHLYTSIRNSIHQLTTFRDQQVTQTFVLVHRHALGIRTLKHVFWGQELSPTSGITNNGNKNADAPEINSCYKPTHIRKKFI